MFNYLKKRKAKREVKEEVEVKQYMNLRRRECWLRGKHLYIGGVVVTRHHGEFVRHLQCDRCGFVRSEVISKRL